MKGKKRSAQIVIVDEQTDDEDKLDVPEEPSMDEEEETTDDDDDVAGENYDKFDGEKEQQQTVVVKKSAAKHPPREGRSTPLTFFTAVGIARWVAKAYGYVSRKKALYNSQDKMKMKEDLFDRGHHPELTVDNPSPRHSASYIKRLGNGNGSGSNNSTSSNGNNNNRPQSRAKSSLEIGRARSGRRTPRSGRASRAGEDDDSDYEIVYEEERIRGDEDHDRKLVCRWIAESYGEEDEEYHRAYSREIIRQSRKVWQRGKEQPVAWL